MTDGVLTRVGAALRAGGPESGWLGRLVGTAVIAGMLIAAEVPAAWIWFAYALAVACWLFFLATDRRWRVAPLVALAVAALSAASTVVAGDTTGTVILFVVLAMFVAHTRTPPLVSGGLAVAIMGLLSWQWLHAGKPFASLLILIGVAAFVTMSALYRRQYHLSVMETAALLEQTRRAQAEQARAAALDERTRIARELHDVLAHSLGALGVQLEVAEALLEQGDATGALARVQRSRRLAAEGLDEAHAAVTALRSDALPLPAALAELAERHRRDHLGPVPDIAVQGPTRPVPAAVGVSLTGTAREALTNAARHAPGAPVQVVLEFAPGAVRLTVHNDSPLRPPQERSGPPGNGLTGMRERLALVGGQLRAGQDGDGWTVVAEVPS
ncbi:sensor histidine kinase [Pseudonocardia sp. GCM10023141]|uniref:sensor histidine kinase n=1 Tax=Pseudonocardia sp. GCM10023141 TaxID=3252653 RepID=UPI003613D1E3